jgi:hypothetical protein
MSPSQAPWPWSVLALDGPPEDPRDIRRAYARKLKAIDANTDVEGFEKLREAYEWARMEADASSRDAHSRFAPAAVEIHQVPTAWPEPESPAGITASEIGEPEAEEANAGPWGHVVPAGGTPLSDVGEVIECARNLIRRRNWTTSAWQALMLAPALEDPHAAHRLEHELVTIFAGANSPSQQYRNASGVPDNTLSAPKFFTQEFVEIIDHRFEWVSDGIGFLNRYPEARNVQMDMAAVSRTSRPSRAQINPHGKPIPPVVWVAPFLGWLYLLYLLY